MSPLRQAELALISRREPVPAAFRPGVDEALSEVGKRAKLFAGVDARGDHLMDSRGTDPRKFLFLSLSFSPSLWPFRSPHSTLLRPSSFYDFIAQQFR